MEGRNLSPLAYFNKSKAFSVNFLYKKIYIFASQTKLVQTRSVYVIEKKHEITYYIISTTFSKIELGKSTIRCGACVPTSINLHCQQIAKTNAASHSLLVRALSNTQLLIQVLKRGTERSEVAAHVSKQNFAIVSWSINVLLKYATVSNNKPGRDVLRHQAVTTSFASVLVRIMFS